MRPSCQAKAAFFETDQDGSGAIDRGELSHMLKSLGQNPTKVRGDAIECFAALLYSKALYYTTLLLQELGLGTCGVVVV